GSGVGLPDQLVHPQEMHFQSVKCGPRRIEAEQPLFNPGPEIYADAAHVSHDQIRALFRGEIDARLPPAAGGIDEVRCQTRFAGSRYARDKDTGAAIVTLAAEHRVQAGDAAGNRSEEHTSEL